MILIYTALLCEAQCFIERYKLKKINSKPKIYTNNKIIICIGGVGKENTFNSLNYIFNNFTIKKAYNIGIAGINNKNIKIGSLFCTTANIKDIPYLQLTTVDKPQVKTTAKEISLYDMEGKYFLEICLKYLTNNNIFILKIVSDHLDLFKLSKDEIKKLIYNNFNIMYLYL